MFVSMFLKNVCWNTSFTNALHFFFFLQKIWKMWKRRRKAKSGLELLYLLYFPMHLIQFPFLLQCMYGMCRVSRWLSDKEPACNSGDTGAMGLIPGLGRSPRGEHGNPLQYSCLENLVDRGAWQATVHRVAESFMTEIIYHTHKNVFIQRRVCT